MLKKSRNINNMPYITYLLLAVMIIMYLILLIMNGTNNPYILIQLGGKFNPLIRAGEWWRLITPIFLHASFEHILFNGITLYFLGMQIEKIFGHARFFGLFILSGIIGNLTSFALNDDISVGASTAIFGLFGAFLMLGESFWDNQYIRNITKTFLIFIILNLVMDIISKGIDIYGHLGGLISGFFIAYIFGLPKKSLNNHLKQVISIFVIIILIIVLWYIGITGKY